MASPEKDKANQMGKEPSLGGKRRRAPLLGSVLGGLYGLLGPRGLIHAYTNSMNILSGPLEFTPEATPAAKAAFVLFLPAVVPILFGMWIAEPSFSSELSLAERSTELVLLFVANALLFAGLGHLMHQAMRALRCGLSSLTGGKTDLQATPTKSRGGLRGIGMLLTGVALLAGTSLTFRQTYRRRPGTYQKRPRIVQKPTPLTVKDLAGKMRVTVGGGGPFELVHQGDGEFKGRQNKLIGSRVVECRYGFSPDKSTISVEIERTLLSPAEFYRHERPGHFRKGKYTVKDGGP